MKIGQSRRWSLIESIANVGVGYIIALAAQYAIFPIFGIYVPFMEHVAIALCFTVVSIVRSYYFRRFFNWLHMR